LVPGVGCAPAAWTPRKSGRIAVAVKIIRHRPLIDTVPFPGPPTLSSTRVDPLAPAYRGGTGGRNSAYLSLRGEASACVQGPAAAKTHPASPRRRAQQRSTADGTTPRASWRGLHASPCPAIRLSRLSLCRSLGVHPTGAQVVRTFGINRKPLSSRYARRAPRRAACCSTGPHLTATLLIPARLFFPPSPWQAIEAVQTVIWLAALAFLVHRVRRDQRSEA